MRSWIHVGVTLALTGCPLAPPIPPGEEARREDLEAQMIAALAYRTEAQAAVTRAEAAVQAREAEVRAAEAPAQAVPPGPWVPPGASPTDERAALTLPQRQLLGATQGLEAARAAFGHATLAVDTVEDELFRLDQAVEVRTAERYARREHRRGMTMLWSGVAGLGVGFGLVAMALMSASRRSFILEGGVQFATPEMRDQALRRTRAATIAGAVLGPLLFFTGGGVFLHGARRLSRSRRAP